MVLLHVKKTDNDQFIYQTSLTESVEEAIVHLTQLHNKRLLTDRIAMSLEELIKFGALKPEATRGLQEGDPEEPPRPDLIKAPDEHHYRIGWAVPTELGLRIMETTTAAKQLLNKANADRRIPITVEQLEEACSLMKGALMMAYPGYHTLEPWEPVVMLFESREVETLLRGEELMKPEGTSIWFAGKELQRGKLLSHFIKGTEQTKAIIKMQKVGAGAPVREPMVDPETQKQMIAMYHKRQEEAKVLGVDSEDDYLNSAWADPRKLKRDLHGASDIGWRPR